MSAPAAETLRLCEACERPYPPELLDSLTSYCRTCLAEVLGQDQQALRELALAALAVDLRAIPGLAEATVAEITRIVEAAWAA
jgi:hypothetical protein